MIKVLVIDDSALMRKLLGRVLADVTEFEVYFARNGMEGLEQLAAVNPDVVTLDIHMPGMDGLACLDRIMIEHPRPVLMVSSSDARGRGCDAGGVASGRGGFRAEARRRAFPAHGRVRAAVRRQGACGRGRQAQGEPSPARTRSASHRRKRIGASTRVGGVGQAPERATGDGIVVVGTSTGGPPALEALLGALPSTFPWPIVIAQHMPANFTGALARRLDGLCAIGVSEVARPTALEPGHAYIGRGDADVVISKIAGDLARVSGARRCRAPLASERRPVGGERHRACSRPAS